MATLHRSVCGLAFSPRGDMLACVGVPMFYYYYVAPPVVGWVQV